MINKVKVTKLSRLCDEANRETKTVYRNNSVFFFSLQSEYGRGEDNFVPKPQSATVNLEANITFASNVNGCTLQDSY